MYPFYLGIDLHLKRTYLVLPNGVQEGGGFPKGTIVGRESSPPDFFLQLKLKIHEIHRIGFPVKTKYGD